MTSTDSNLWLPYKHTFFYFVVYSLTFTNIDPSAELSSHILDLDKSDVFFGLGQ